MLHRTFLLILLALLALPQVWAATSDHIYLLPQEEVDRAVASTADNTVDVGDTAVVGVFGWIEVHSSITNGNRTLLAGDKCAVNIGHLQEVDSLLANEKVLVKYHRYGKRAYDTQCPDGVLFVVTRDEFLRSSAA